MLNLNFTHYIFKEGDMFVAYAPELDVSSCGHTMEEARRNLKDAVKGFLESARDRGMLDQLLIEAGYQLAERGEQWNAPELRAFERDEVSLQYA